MQVFSRHMLWGRKGDVSELGIITLGSSASSYCKDLAEACILAYKTEYLDSAHIEKIHNSVIEDVMQIYDSKTEMNKILSRTQDWLGVDYNSMLFNTSYDSYSERGLEYRRNLASNKSSHFDYKKLHDAIRFWWKTQIEDLEKDLNMQITFPSLLIDEKLLLSSRLQNNLNPTNSLVLDHYFVMINLINRGGGGFLTPSSEGSESFTRAVFLQKDGWKILRNILGWFEPDIPQNNYLMIALLCARLIDGLLLSTNEQSSASVESISHLLTILDPRFHDAIFNWFQAGKTCQSPGDYALDTKLFDPTYQCTGHHIQEPDVLSLQQFLMISIYPKRIFHENKVNLICPTPQFNTGRIAKIPARKVLTTLLISRLKNADETTHSYPQILADLILKHVLAGVKIKHAETYQVLTPIESYYLQL